MVTLAVIFALWVWSVRGGAAFGRTYILSQVEWLLFLPALWLFLAALNDFYDLRLASQVRSSGMALLRTTALLLLIYLVIYFFSPPSSLPRGIVLYHAVSSFVLVGLWRMGYTLLLSRAAFQRRAIVVGAGWAGRTIVQAIRENLASGYQLVGFIDDDPAKQGQAIEGLPVIGTRHDLVPLARAERVSEVILAITHEVHGELFKALMNCQELGIRITLMPLLYEEITGKVPVRHIGESWPAALPLDHPSTGSLFPAFKRGMDIIISIIGLAMLAILFPFVSLAIYIDSPGPIFYVQERVGRVGRTFRAFKFRSMILGAEEEGKAIWAEVRDARVTRVGRFLRATHIDELPQFINVLRGEMSVVGPRPERPEFVAELEKIIPFYRLRHAVRPGMAGWALVNCGYGSSVEDALLKLEYDLYYIKHQSIYLDFLILLKTIGQMLVMRGR
jgi:exopolysaccharide biosynthesis polyprenyl glycosylphosphotransferase